MTDTPQIDLVSIHDLMQANGAGILPDYGKLVAVFHFTTYIISSGAVK